MYPIRGVSPFVCVHVFDGGCDIWRHLQIKVPLQNDDIIKRFPTESTNALFDVGGLIRQILDDISLVYAKCAKIISLILIHFSDVNALKAWEANV